MNDEISARSPNAAGLKSAFSDETQFHQKTKNKNIPFRNLEKETEESMAHSDSLGNNRESGEFRPCRLFVSPYLPANVSYFRLVRPVSVFSRLLVIWSSCYSLMRAF